MHRDVSERKEVSERMEQKAMGKLTGRDSTEEKKVGTSKYYYSNGEEFLPRLSRFARDEIIQSFQNETGYSRRSASIITRNKDPNEILKEVNKIKERQKSLRR